MFSNVKYNEELINRHLLSTLFRKSIERIIILKLDEYFSLKNLNLA